MFKPKTKVLVNNRAGVISTHRRVPKSKPIAYEYKVDFPDGKYEWVKRYDVQLVNSEQAGARAKCSYCGVEDDRSCFKKGLNNTLLCLDNVTCMDRRKEQKT